MVPLGTSLTCVQSPHEGDSILSPVPNDSSIGDGGLRGRTDRFLRMNLRYSEKEPLSDFLHQAVLERY